MAARSLPMTSCSIVVVPVSAMLLTPSFRGAAKRRARNPYPRAVVMDSGLLATLGPGMTNVEIELQATLLSGAFGDEADEFSRGLAGEAELLEREPVARIVDADREPR